MIDDPAGELAGRVQQVLERFCRQNGGVAGLAPAIETIAARVVEIARERAGVARAQWGSGDRPEMSATEVSALSARLLAELSRADRLAAPVKHLVKGCFQAAPHTCRDEYGEVDRGGVCRRQVLGTARERVSGAFCVDCPYWQTLSRDEMAARLAQTWRGDVGELESNRDVFLPEDFRALRRIAGEVSSSE